MKTPDVHTTETLLSPGQQIARHLSATPLKPHQAMSAKRRHSNPVYGLRRKPKAHPTEHVTAAVPRPEIAAERRNVTSRLLNTVGRSPEANAPTDPAAKRKNIVNRG